MSAFRLSWLLMMRGAICHFPSERLQLHSAAAAEAEACVFICPGQCHAYVTAIDGLFTQAGREGGGGDQSKRGKADLLQIHCQTRFLRGAPPSTLVLSC